MISAGSLSIRNFGFQNVIFIQRKNLRFQKVLLTGQLNLMPIPLRHQVRATLQPGTGHSMRNRDRIQSECVEYRTNEYYNFAETVRKFRRAFGVSAIGEQILNLALFVLSGNFVRRIWRHSKICQSMQCQGSCFSN